MGMHARHTVTLQNRAVLGIDSRATDAIRLPDILKRLPGARLGDPMVASWCMVFKRSCEETDTYFQR